MNQSFPLNVLRGLVTAQQENDGKSSMIPIGCDKLEIMYSSLKQLYIHSPIKTSGEKCLFSRFVST